MNQISLFHIIFLSKLIKTACFRKYGWVCLTSSGVAVITVSARMIDGGRRNPGEGTMQSHLSTNPHSYVLQINMPKWGRHMSNEYFLA